MHREHDPDGAHVLGVGEDAHAERVRDLLALRVEHVSAQVAALERRERAARVRVREARREALEAVAPRHAAPHGVLEVRVVDGVARDALLLVGRERRLEHVAQVRVPVRTQAARRLAVPLDEGLEVALHLELHGARVPQRRRQAEVRHGALRRVVLQRRQPPRVEREPGVRVLEVPGAAQDRVRRLLVRVERVVAEDARDAQVALARLGVERRERAPPARRALPGRHAQPGPARRVDGRPQERRDPDVRLRAAAAVGHAPHADARVEPVAPQQRAEQRRVVPDVAAAPRAGGERRVPRVRVAAGDAARLLEREQGHEARRLVRPVEHAVRAERVHVRADAPHLAGFVAGEELDFPLLQISTSTLREAVPPLLRVQVKGPRGLGVLASRFAHGIFHVVGLEGQVQSATDGDHVKGHVQRRDLAVDAVGPGRLERDGPRATPVQERLAPVQGRRGHELALVRERVAHALPRHRDPERRRPALDQLPPGAGRLRRGPRNFKKEAAPQLRVDARRGQPRRRALAVEREVRPHRARHAVRLGQLGHEGRAALDVDLQREDVARRRPAHAVRAAEQLRRRAPLGGGHEPPEQGVLLQALAAVLLGAGVVERLPDLPVGVGVAQQAVQFAAEVLELGVARLGRRHEGGHDGVLGLPLPAALPVFVRAPDAQASSLFLNCFALRSAGCGVERRVLVAF